jgi:hypothetical protein
VVEGARLESVYSGNAIAGSNPALSAKIWSKKVRFHDLRENAVHFQILNSSDFLVALSISGL